MAKQTKSQKRRNASSWIQRQFSQRPLPVWIIVVADVLIFGVSLNVFALFHHVLPRQEASLELVSNRYQMSSGYAMAGMATEAPRLPDAYYAPVEATTMPESIQAQAVEPADDAQAAETADDAQPAESIENAEANAEAPAEVENDVIGHFARKFANKFTDGEVIKTNDSYQSGSLNVKLSKLTYYHSNIFVADVYVKDISQLKTAFANDTFGQGHREWPRYMNRRANGVVAINGDNYGARADGVVIRNGELYRNKRSGLDVCVIFWDGTMGVYRGKDFDAKAAISNGAYQAWNFGPVLLDGQGNALKKFSNTSVEHINPRTVLGYYEPGHYCFVVVDGRSEVSKGMDFKDLADIMHQLGCRQAYNLDGGNTSMMMVGDNVINDPSEGGRASSDIILFTEE